MGYSLLEKGKGERGKGKGERGKGEVPLACAGA
jgi:hypothetical protein